MNLFCVGISHFFITIWRCLLFLFYMNGYSIKRTAAKAAVLFLFFHFFQLLLHLKHFIP